MSLLPCLFFLSRSLPPTDERCNHVGSGAAAKPQLEHLPHAIAEAITKDEEDAQTVEDMVHALTSMASLAKQAVLDTERDNEDALAEARKALADT